ncbi:MAG: response regulator [Elusimicrobia bacterium]|nr:response regulator [Elusimicrobiota bacterium]
MAGEEQQEIRRRALDCRLRGILQRTSTFVSVDVVDSTGMKMGETEEDVIFSFLAYQKMIEEIIERHNGQVVSITGDGVMSRYSLGADAVEAAVEMLQKLPQFNKSTQLLKTSFKIRLGINTGKVYVDTSEEKTALQLLPSSAIDLAGYLQKNAPVNSVWISQFTVEQIEKPNPQISRSHYDKKFGFYVYEYKADEVFEKKSRTRSVKPKILIIEDEPDQAHMFSEACAASGYETETAYDGAEGLLYVKTFKPDLIMLDIGLPRMDGWLVLHEMKANRMAPKIPVLMLARRYKVEDIERSFTDGASGCFKKSSDLKLLMRKIETLLS